MLPSLMLFRILVYARRSKGEARIDAVVVVVVMELVEVMAVLAFIAVVVVVLAAMECRFMSSVSW